MKLLGWIVGLAVLFILAAVFYPLAVPYIYDGKRDAFRRVLSFHTAAHVPPRNKQIPLVYLSDFPTGNPKYAEETIIYPNGGIYIRRVLWNHGIQGSGSQMRNVAALQALKRLPPLLPGLSSPDSVKYKKLLIVSQQASGQWKTYYYDRTRLPAPMRRMQGLITAAAP